MSPIITMTRRLEFDYGHRLITHEGKCANYHGHRGVVEITCSTPMLDVQGMVVDFGEVKRVVGGWIDEHLDHGMILQAGDQMVEALRSMFEAGDGIKQQGDVSFQLGRPKLAVVPFPPTAEHLASYLLRVSTGLLCHTGITVERVRFYETPNGWADATMM